MKKTRLLISFSVIILALSVIAYGFSVIDANTNVTRVACIGDSITQGSGYPDRLQELLGSDYEVGNFGVDGSTVSQETAMPYMRQDKFIDAMEFKPDIVIIMLGTNDANPEINYNWDTRLEEDFVQLVDSFRALDGDQRVIIAKSPPILNGNPQYNNSYLKNTVFPQIDKLSQKLDLPTVDIYNSLGENPEYFFDGIHPDDDGASIIASKLCDALT